MNLARLPLPVLLWLMFVIGAGLWIGIGGQPDYIGYFLYAVLGLFFFLIFIGLIGAFTGRK